MSGRSSKSSKRKAKAADRPFDPKVMVRAKEIAAGYKIILETDKDVGFVGHALELPTVFADGQTPTECVASVRESLATTVATMIELGQRPPLASSQAKRQTQVNIRLTDEEKLLLEDAARRQGFRGLSDYIRSAALAKAG
jgi:predicted RNase H-like HicB family nuclease